MNLYSIAEQAYRQLFPDPNDETKLQLGDFVATAKAEYATIFWLHSKEEKRSEGEWEIPSFLLEEIDLEVDNGIVDITDLKALKSLPNDEWIREVGTYECPYVKTSVSRNAALRDDDSLGERKTYLRIGNKIAFPRGTYGKKVRMLFANNGERAPKDLQISENLAGTIRSRLIEIYAGKVGAADVTNNTNPER